MVGYTQFALIEIAIGLQVMVKNSRRGPASVMIDAAVWMMVSTGV